MKKIYNICNFLVYFSILFICFILILKKDMRLYVLFSIVYLLSFKKYIHKLKLLINYKMDRNYYVLEKTIIIIIFLFGILFFIDVLSRLFFNYEVFSMYILLAFSILIKFLIEKINYVSSDYFIANDKVIKLVDIQSLKYINKKFNNKIKVDIVLKNKQEIYGIEVYENDYNKLYYKI